MGIDCSTCRKRGILEQNLENGNHYNKEDIIKIQSVYRGKRIRKKVMSIFQAKSMTLESTYYLDDDVFKLRFEEQILEDEDEIFNLQTIKEIHQELNSVYNEIFNLEELSQAKVTRQTEDMFYCMSPQAFFNTFKLNILLQISYSFELGTLLQDCLNNAKEEIQKFQYPDWMKMTALNTSTKNNIPLVNFEQTHLYCGSRSRSSDELSDQKQLRGGSLKHSQVNINIIQKDIDSNLRAKSIKFSAERNVKFNSKSEMPKTKNFTYSNNNSFAKRKKSPSDVSNSLEITKILLKKETFESVKLIEIEKKPYSNEDSKEDFQNNHFFRPFADEERSILSNSNQSDFSDGNLNKEKKIPCENFLSSPDNNSSHKLELKPSFEVAIDSIYMSSKKQCIKIKEVKNEKFFYAGQFDALSSRRNGLGKFIRRKSESFNDFNSILSRKKSIPTKYKYFGFIHNNVFHGYGILLRKGGYYYKGEFRNNRYNGYGIEHTDDYTYSGFFKDGKMEGFGELKYRKNNHMYYGGFKAGLKNGIGFELYENGCIYVGYFWRNKINGIGLIMWSNIHRYFGHWKDGKMNGRGKYFFPNGDYYIGHFEDDLRHGLGEYYFESSKLILKGQWEKGKKQGNFKIQDDDKIYSISYKNDFQVS